MFFVTIEAPLPHGGIFALNGILGSHGTVVPCRTRPTIELLPYIVIHGVRVVLVNSGDDMDRVRRAVELRKAAGGTGST